MEQRADAPRDLVLVINSGSSSLKYQLLRAGRAEVLTKAPSSGSASPTGWPTTTRR